MALNCMEYCLNTSQTRPLLEATLWTSVRQKHRRGGGSPELRSKLIPTEAGRGNYDFNTDRSLLSASAECHNSVQTFLFNRATCGCMNSQMWGADSVWTLFRSWHFQDLLPLAVFGFANVQGRRCPSEQLRQSRGSSNVEVDIDVPRKQVPTNMDSRCTEAGILYSH
jgi:hypothetical protein